MLTAFKFTVISSLVSNSSVAEERNHRSNDTKCAELVYVFGGTEDKWALRQNCPKSIAIAALYGRLNLTLVRANVRAILNRGFQAHELTII